MIRVVYPRALNMDPPYKDYVNAESAMAEFAAIAAKHGGFDSIRADGASIFEIKDGPPPVPPAPVSPAVTSATPQVAPPSPSPVAGTVTVTGRAGEVSAVAAARVARHEQYLKENGIILPPPVYAAGTRVIDTGLDNFKASRTEWETLPFAKDAALSLAERVRAENREDFTIPISKIRMLPNGSISIPESPVSNRELFLEPVGFGQMIEAANHVLPRAKSLLSILKPGLRADVFNEQIAKAGNEPIKLRLRDNKHGGNVHQSVYAAVSKGYSPFNIDLLADSLAESFGDMGYRAEVIYVPETTSLKFTGYYHADHVVDLAAGDVFKVGVQITAADNGTGGINIKAVAIRNRCLNLIILGTGAANLMSKRHRGEQSFNEVRIWDAINRANEIFAPFAEEWKIARRVDMNAFVNEVMDDPSKLEGDTEEEQIANWIIGETEIGKIIPVKADIFSEMLVASLHRENENGSVADWMNALTRLHENEAFSNENTHKVEEAVWPLLQKINKKAMAMSLA